MPVLMPSARPQLPVNAAFFDLLQQADQAPRTALLMMQNDIVKGPHPDQYEVYVVAPPRASAITVSGDDAMRDTWQRYIIERKQSLKIDSLPMGLIVRAYRDG